jgi:hypothetical protein
MMFSLLLGFCESLSVSLWDKELTKQQRWEVDGMVTGAGSFGSHDSQDA